MTLLVAETSVRPATTEETQWKQALTMRPSWTRTPAKRKYEDFLLGEEEDLPFEEETADFDGPTQVPYFDFVQPQPLVNDEAQREDAEGATETVTEVPQGPAPD